MTADQNGKNPFSQAEPESEASTDWEEAFQAEDYLIPSQEPQSAVSEGPADNHRKKERAGVPRFGADGERPERIAASRGGQGGAANRFVAFFELLGSNRFIRSLVARLPVPLRQLPVLRSAAGRGAFLSLTFVLSCLLLLSFGGRTVREAKVEESPPVPVVNNSPGMASKKPTMLPVATETAQPTPAASPPAVTPENADKKEGDSSIVRRKWRFSSFMINASQNAAEDPSYVVVDLSIILRLRPGEAFPEDKEYAVREMIYQFFSNRPLYELRRFSLARGEMKSKLEAWFRKEWPNNPIESIFFHRYQIT